MNSCPCQVVDTLVVSPDCFPAKAHKVESINKDDSFVCVAITCPNVILFQFSF